MKSIAGFTAFVIILCAQGASAQEKTGNAYNFSFGSQFGVLYGQAEEIVYPVDTKAQYLSQLLWDVKPVFYGGLLMEFSPARPAEKSGVCASLSLKYGIPGSSGKMEDRDWMSIENTALTHFSSHDNVVREVMLVDASAGYSFSLARFMAIKPFVSFSFMRYRFSGMDGYGLYASETSFGSGMYKPIDDSTPKYFFEGKVINYTQEWFHIAPGLSYGLFFLRNFLAEISFQISPLIVCIDLDEHLKTKYQYRDYVRGGLLIEPAFRFAYAAGWVEFSAAFSWRHIAKSKGDTYARSPIGTGIYHQQGIAGTGLSIMDTGLFVKVRL